MKGPQLSALIWLANLVVLAGGAFAGYHFYNEIQTDRDAVYAKVSEPKTKEKRVTWQETVDAATTADHTYYRDVMLSPAKRPVKPPPPKETPKDPPPPPPEPTDAELKAELEKWVNQQFNCLRLLYGPESIASAVVISKEAGNATLLFRPGLKFKEEYKESLDNKVKKLAQYDLSVVSIELDHVVMNGPSRNPKYKDKYFDVNLSPDPKAFEKPDASKLGKTGKIGESKIKLPETTPPDPTVEVVDTRPKESVYDPDTDTWTLGTDDYKNVNVDDLARYAKVVHDREGNPLGIQISDDIPDDNSVIARGGRRGDIIKAINGQKVASMSDVRRIVRTEYNNGVQEFVVTYERDGVPGTKIFKVPARKNN